MFSSETEQRSRARGRCSNGRSNQVADVVNTGASHIQPNTSAMITATIEAVCILYKLNWANNISVKYQFTTKKANQLQVTKALTMNIFLQNFDDM